MNRLAKEQKHSQDEEMTATVPEQASEQETQESEQQAPEKNELELLEDQLAAQNDKLLRTIAEYDNFRKRSQREKDAIYPVATAAAVSQFLPILDTFDRALSTPCSDEEFKKGVEMILQNFRDALQKLGVEEFAQPGDVFNPEMHNAVMHIEDDTIEQSVLVEVFQKGYRLGDRVVRHAMVKVAN